MSKQDRQGVRTAADLERKYNLGRVAQGSSTSGNTNNPSNNSEQLSKVVQELSDHKTKSNNKFKEIQGTMDIVSALANANKAAQEANASAITSTQAEVKAVSRRVTTLENWHDGYAEADSLDIQNLFLEYGE